MGRVSAAPTPISTPTREELGAEFCDLDSKIQDFAATAKRFKILQDLIRGWYADEPADQPAIFEGANYRIHIGARGEERSLSAKAKTRIFTLMGKVRAMNLFSVTLKAVEDELGKPALDALVTRDFTGSRKLVAVLKSAKAQAA